MRPTTADELADERVAAAEAGVDLDDWRAQRDADLAARAAEYRAELRRKHPLDPATIELGRRNVAELRAFLAERARARKAQP